MDPINPAFLSEISSNTGLNRGSQPQPPEKPLSLENEPPVINPRAIPGMVNRINASFSALTLGKEREDPWKSYTS